MQDTTQQEHRQARPWKLLVPRESGPEGGEGREWYLIRRSLSGRDVIDSASAGLLPRPPSNLLRDTSSSDIEHLLPGYTYRYSKLPGTPKITTLPAESLPQIQWSCADVKESSSARWCCCQWIRIVDLPRVMTRF